MKNKRRFRTVSRSLALLTLLATPISFAANTSNNSHHHSHNQSANELAKHLEAADRDGWQKPKKVIALLGNIKGKKVLDIGAGTGYFSFKLAEIGAHVIAADVDSEFLKIIEDKQQKKQLSKEQLQTRKVPFDSPGLVKQEVEAVLIVDTYHHIENRVAYFSKVRSGLTPKGKLVVVDYKKDPAITDGPPMSIRLPPETVSSELRKAGFTNITVNTTLLPKQYIIEAYPTLSAVK